MLAWFGLQRAPVRDDVGAIAVNLEPGDRLGQHGAVKKRTMGRIIAFTSVRIAMKINAAPMPAVPGFIESPM